MRSQLDLVGGPEFSGYRQNHRLTRTSKSLAGKLLTSAFAIAMGETSSRPPIHESLDVVDVETLYKNEWWKAVVKYQFEDSPDSSEVAMYLWHDEDGWTRKNKYTIKTREAWETDKEIITRFLSNDSSRGDDDLGEECPVSNYYSVAEAETVFKSDGWWKAVLKIGKKGNYETEEVMVYLWQKRDESWKRRQKYTIKRRNDWRDEADAVESLLGTETSTSSENESSDETDELPRPSNQFQRRSKELEAHLSKSVQKSN